jgi:hypothetical protein
MFDQYGKRRSLSSSVGDIAPREGFSKAEKQRLEAVSLLYRVDYCEP